MTTADIVERLRKQGREVCVLFVPLIPQENEYEWRADPLCAEAADEIERLRAVRRDAANFLAMNIVNQLMDLAEVPVGIRQRVNDRADTFVFEMLTREGDDGG